MSFYGNVYYQLIDAFYKAAIKNNGKNKNDFIPNDSPDEAIDLANGRKGEITLDTGNRWIRLSSSDEDGTNAYYIVWHGQPDPMADNEHSGFDIVTENDKATKLISGGYFSTDVVKYDDAGHISKIDKKYFQLPDPDYEVSALTDRVKKNEDDIKDINETKLVSINKRDDDQDKEIDDIQEQLKIVDPEAIDKRFQPLEEFKTTAGEAIGKNTENIETLDKNTTERFQAVEKYTGQTDSSTNLTDGEKQWNLSEIIGQVRSFQETFDRESRTSTLIDIIIDLQEQLQKSNSQIDNQSLIINTLINPQETGIVNLLQKRVDALEAEIKNLKGEN